MTEKGIGNAKPQLGTQPNYAELGLSAPSSSDFKQAMIIDHLELT